MVLKITRDELLMEWGVYGGCLLCPLYPLLLAFKLAGDRVNFIVTTKRQIQSEILPLKKIHE